MSENQREGEQSPPNERVSETVSDVRSTASERMGDVTQESKQRADEAREKASELGQAAQERAAAAREKASELGQKAQERAEVGRERAAEGMHRMAERLRERGGTEGMGGQASAKVAERVDKAAGYLHERKTSDIMSDVERYTKEHPMRAIAAAVLAGFVLGKILW